MIIIIIIIGMNTSPRRLPKRKKSLDTDREPSANKPDIVTKDHAGTTRAMRILVFVSRQALLSSKFLLAFQVIFFWFYHHFSMDRNTSTKVNEKLTKYKDLDIKTTRM